MTPADFRKAEDLFEQLRELDEGKRKAALDSVCPADHELRLQVLRLLEADSAAGSFLEGRALDDAARRLAADSPGLPASGTVIGNYRLLSRIGAGGMGVVYEAQDLRLPRRAALKILQPQFPGEGEEIVRRFQREARAASLLNHPNIVTIFDAGIDLGHYYIAMEFVEGKTFLQFASEGPQPRKQLLDMATQVCSALSAAHRAGIVHRDIKPENLMIRPDGIVKVLDFGLARVDRSDERDLSVSHVGGILGTAAYMSPEQAAGRPADARTDIFSFGAVLYEMLRGRRVENQDTGVEEPLSRDPAISRVIACCLARDPAERYQTAEQLGNALEAAKLNVSRQPSIAVLPFEDPNGAEDDQYFSNGLSDGVRDLLSLIRGLKVIARTSSVAFRSQHWDIRKIAQMLDVEVVLEGSVQRNGDRVRVRAQLISGSDGACLWSHSYDCKTTDAFALQDEVAAKIAGALQVRFSPHVRHTPQPAAYEAYLKGMSYVYSQTPEGIARGKECFLQAIAIDPECAAAHWGLARIYVGLTHYDAMPPRQVVPQARAALLKALELDPFLPLARAWLGGLACIYDGDLEEGKRQFRLARDFDAVPAEVHEAASMELYLLGRVPAAAFETERALELDPLNVTCRRTFAFYLYSAGILDRAFAEVRRTLEIDPKDWLTHALLGRLHVSTGQLQDARRGFEQAHKLAPWNARIMGLYGGVLARMGERELAAELLGRVSKAQPHHIPLSMALYYLLCPDMGAAADWFEKAVEHRSLALFMYLRDPILEPLRQSLHWPRLKRLLRLPDPAETANGVLIYGAPKSFAE